ncbi:MFS transporter [Sciscionella sediminilitoris]|uniref:MFS transporter n=1 Tax=Sciscionella sediminilitoris TaxID=1445613 RepID=UPI0004DF6577|nr:MFS transporter [Sciscionella sp. SE31]
MADFSVAARLNALPITALHRKATVVIGIGFFFDLYESFLSGILAVTLTEELGGSATAKKLLLASVYVGSFFGALIMSRVADRIGRRTAFLATLAVYSVFSLLGAFSNSVELLIVARFLAGVGIGAELPLGAVYLADLLPSAVRGRFVALAFTVGFCGMPVAGFAGMALAPAAPLGIEGWRWLLGAGAVGAVLIWFLRRTLPESPRWLESVGRQAEADEATRRFERLAGDRAREPVELEPERERLSLRQLFAGQWRKRTVMLWIFHVFQTVGYYGFGTMVPLVLQQKGFEVTSTLAYTALSYLGYPVGSLLSVPIMERGERKWLVCGGALAMIAFGLAFGFTTSAALIAVFGFCYTLSSNFFSNAYHAYEVEIFPTSVRATAAGSAYSISRLTNAAMPFLLVPVLDLAGSASLFAVIVAAMVLVIVDVAVLGPRTTGRSLESISYSGR